MVLVLNITCVCVLFSEICFVMTQDTRWWEPFTNLWNAMNLSWWSLLYRLQYSVDENGTLSSLKSCLVFVNVLCRHRKKKLKLFHFLIKHLSFIVLLPAFLLIEIETTSFYFLREHSWAHMTDTNVPGWLRALLEWEMNELRGLRGYHLIMSPFSTATTLWAVFCCGR